MDEQNLQRFDSREHVRLRPGMYFGGRSGKDDHALHKLTWVLLENSLDQAYAKQCDHIHIVLQDGNRVTISDNGPGIPVTNYKNTEYSILELILTKPGGKSFNPETNTFSGGMFGAGLGAVNAVSAELSIEVKRDGFLWQQWYRQGIKQIDLQQVRPLSDNEGTGTTATFQPDFAIFEPNLFDYERLQLWMRECAWLLPGLTIVLDDKRTESSRPAETFSSSGGLADFVRHLNRDYYTLHEVVTAKELTPLLPKQYGFYKPLLSAVEVHIAFQYCDAKQPLIVGFLNGENLEQGGTQVQGFVNGLIHETNDFALQEYPLSDSRNHFVASDILPGLSAVISIWDPTARLDSNFGLSNVAPKSYKDTYDLTCRAVEDFAKTHPDEMYRIVEHCLPNKELRLQRRNGN